MAAQSVDVFVLDFSDPTKQYVQQRRNRVKPDQSFEYPTDRIRTLSTNSVNQGAQIQGLLYVPDLPPNHPCIDASAQYIPENVTRLHDLPSIQYQYVAFAPWFSAECTKAYLAAVPGRLLSAFLFYPTSQFTTTTPPQPSDPIWNLEDGGVWKKNKFPVYAIPGPDGGIIMQQLAQYSGKVMDVKSGDRLAEEGDPSDYVRLYANFELDIDNNLPTLWAFLLIVLAVVLILVGITSLAMHYVQRRNRRNLRRRVENGEVDIEMLGLRRQQMAQADVEALPLILYVPNKDKPDLPIPETVATKSTPPAANDPTKTPSDYNQPTCPICLDEYTPAETHVRVLPCNHIYHPECIDHYLLTTSTLCPMCKSNSKPLSRGQCPEITNAMVRRERHARRLRSARNGNIRSNRNQEGEGVHGLGRWAFFRRHYRMPIRSVPLVRPLPGQDISSRSLHAMAGASVESTNRETREQQTGRQSEVMRQIQAMSHPTPVQTPAPSSPLPQSAAGRREWARSRASDMLGRNAEDTYVEAAERERPRWRRGVGTVFPGFR